MGLSRSSTGKDVLFDITNIDKSKHKKKIIALAGNPNVGKSTLFNALTGMHQHTGNWTGKTVKSAVGTRIYNKEEYIFVDLPGCYSLKTRSPEEEVAKDFIYSETADITIVVCDAGSLERNLNLLLQIKEATHDLILCVNLMDEAKRKNIKIDLDKLSKILNVKVIGTSANKKDCIYPILEAISSYDYSSHKTNITPPVKYPDYIEELILKYSDKLPNPQSTNRSKAIEAIENDNSILAPEEQEKAKDIIISAILDKAKTISDECVKANYSYTCSKDFKIDKLLTGKTFGFITMFLFFLTIFWITIAGANYPSQILGNFFTHLEQPLYSFLIKINIPVSLCNLLVYGIYNVLTKIISVMLPPMAIFFPLFTLLEDIGYLPRIAFNLDKAFKKCSACGKQALTTCMGFGCNSAGVVGCRIIDSTRERLIAILTNSFIPCNGKFPSIISIITLFFVTSQIGLFNSLSSAFILALVVSLAVCISLLISFLLSKTLLKGENSSFVLELPPYRKPQLGKIIIRSVLDRTFFVLGRAVLIAAPAGLIIWLLSNLEINGIALISYISNFLDPIGKIMGLDGVILTAFILGFPANEIVIPLILMMYTNNTMVNECESLLSLKQILVSNGWTYVTAINMIIFMLFHWPCSTTCLTIKAETKSIKWTFAAFLLPTIVGVSLCILINLIT